MLCRSETMQTPQALAEWEAWRRKQGSSQLGMEATLERIVEKAGITSRGGMFEFPLNDLQDVPAIQEYCERYGWKCMYEPYHVSPAFGDYTLTVHMFSLKPLR